MRTVPKASLLASAVFLAGCVGCIPSAGLKFYPVPTGTNASTSAAILQGNLSGLMSGTVSVVLVSGEICTGPWYPVDLNTDGTEPGRVKTLAAKNLSSAWDEVYGPGYFKAHVLGTPRYVRALMIGDQGSQFQIEADRDEGEHATLKGVAMDGKGNIFKVTI